jgi:TonB family protein
MRLSHRLALLAVCTAILLAPNSLSQAQQDQSEGKARKMVMKVVPVYPGLAQRMSIAGTVKIEGVIGPNGTVKSAEVLGGHPVLAQAAVDAFRKSKWEAAPRETKEVVIFNFHP